jgi:hypothetical protein
MRETQEMGALKREYVDAGGIYEGGVVIRYSVR